MIRSVSWSKRIPEVAKRYRESCGSTDIGEYGLLQQNSLFGMLNSISINFFNATQCKHVDQL